MIGVNEVTFQTKSLSPRRRGSNNAATVSIVSSLSNDSLVLEEEQGGEERLDLSSAPLVLAGRSAEMQTLKEVYERMLSSSSEVICVHGVSGSGKTQLVQSGLCNYMATRRGFFAGGKFEQVQQDGLPYSAIVTCFTDLVDLVLQSSHVDRIREAVKDALGPEISTLIRQISNLRFLVDDVEDTSSLPQNEESILLQGKVVSQFITLCKSFVRAIAAPEHPVVLFFDDMQWVDENSRELVKAFVSDPEWESVLIVTAFRDEESVGDGTFPAATAATGDCSRAWFEGICKLPVTTIEVSCLSIDGINDLISEMLKMDKETTEPLSRVLKTKTFGNVCHVRSFMALLNSRDLLTFSETEDQWQWSTDLILKNTNISENVMSLVSHRMERLDPRIRECLQLASFLGFDFKYDLLFAIVVDVFRAIDSESKCDCRPTVESLKTKVQQVLDTSVNQGLIERRSDGVFKFTHDSIHEFLYKSMDPTEAMKLHLRIGRHVHGQLNESSSDSALLLMAAEHMNKGKLLVVTKREKIELAEVNLRAGVLAARRGAYCTGFLDHAMSLLDPSDWKNEYSLCLELYSTAAEQNFGSGRLDEALEMTDRILTHAQCLTDKLRAHEVRINVYGSEGRLQEAGFAAFRVLRELGEPFPRRATPVHAVYEFVRVWNRVKKLSDEELFALPKMEDERKLAAARILWTLSWYAFFYDSRWMLACVSFRIAYLSVVHGVSPVSPYSFAMLAVSCIQMQDFKKGVRYGRLALRMLQRTKFSAQPSTLVLVHTLVNHWQRPLEESVEPCTRAYDVGSRVGDHLFSVIGGSAAVSMSLYCGYPLIELEEDLRMIRAKAEALQHGPLLSVIRPHLQLIQNFAGMSGDPFILSGDACDESELRAENAANKNQMGAQILAFDKLFLCVYMGNWEPCQSVILELRKHERAMATNWLATFFAGIAMFQMLQATGRRKHRKAALKIMKKLSQWVDMGNVNCEPLLALLQAEQKSTQPNVSTAELRAAYDKAINSMAEHSFPNHQALANERAAEALLSRGDRAAVTRYASQAYTLYERWQAYAKARIVAARYRQFLLK